MIDDILMDNKIIFKEIAEKMKKIIDFKNIAVHDYQNLSLEITKKVIKSPLTDFEEFVQSLLS